MLSDKELACWATFVCGHRKTGTTLLVALLDSHPELMTIPTDSGFFYAYYPVYEQGDYTIQEKKCRIIERCLSEFGQFLENIEGNRGLNFSIKDMEREFDRLTESARGDTRELLLAMAMTYRHTSPLPIALQKRWVEKTTSTEIYAARIKRWFPEAKFIHIIRDPRDNYGSLKSGWEKRYKNFNDRIERLLQSHLERGLLGMNLARWNAERFGDDYLVMKFEDLTSDPEKEMQRVAGFLNISFDEILLKPSVWGLPWAGNNFEGKKFTGVSSVNANRWRERITPHEARVIEFYYENLMNFFGYETSYSKSEQIDAVMTHYEWYNYAQVYSAKQMRRTGSKS